MTITRKITSYLLVFLTSFFLVFEAFADNNLSNHIVIETSNIVIQDIETQVCIKIIDKNNEIANTNLIVKVFIDEKKTDLYLSNGQACFNYKFNKKTEILISHNDIVISSKNINPIPLWTSILPPLIVILLSLILREIFVSLFLGIYCGSLIIWFHSGNNVLISIFKSFFSVFDEYLLRSINNPEHIYILLFSMMIGATIFIITKNGGMMGIINYLLKYAKSPRSVQFISFLLGTTTFLDDRSNTLVVGDSMSPITDKFKVSREKLAYIIDSTAAPLASIAFVTTWIAAELTYIQYAIEKLALDTSAYQIFLISLKYSFYPILSLIFLILLILLNRDFSYMYKCESDARNKVSLIPRYKNKIDRKIKDFNLSKEIVKPKAYMAIIPIIVIILATIFGIFYTGWDNYIWNNGSLGLLDKISITIRMTDSYKALLYSSSAGLLSSVILSMLITKTKLKNISEDIVKGFKTMLTAIVILILAWALAEIISDLHTADFITEIFSLSRLHPSLLPLACLLFSGLISFTTGFSWATMAIIYPIMLPSTWLICQNFGLDSEHSNSIFVHACSTIIAGSVFGEHCSPISKTTILSSLAASCNKIQHIKTQLPYALTVVAITIICGTIPVSFGVNIWISYAIMILTCLAVIMLIGKKHKTETNNQLFN